MLPCITVCVCVQRLLNWLVGSALSAHPCLLTHLPLSPLQVHHAFGSAFVRGIFANWLVGIATWQANAAQDMIGKAVAIW